VILSSLLSRMKSHCGPLIEHVFPEQRQNFEDVWAVLASVFRKWGKLEPGVRNYSVEDLFKTTGLAFADARDWAMPIAVLTAVATMLEMWNTGGGFRHSEVRRILRKYADSFGAPRELRDLLEEKALPFCIGFYRGMKWDGEHYSKEGTQRMQKIRAELKQNVQHGDNRVTPAEPIDASGEKDYFRIWTERGCTHGGEREYKDKYEREPVSGGPTVWINMISGAYSIRKRRTQKRCKVALSGQPLELLCIYLRNFNKRIPHRYLTERIPVYPQVLNRLHSLTFGVLRPFIQVEWGEARKLAPSAKDDRRIKLTFCLIDYYKKPGSEEENSQKHSL